MFYKTKPQIKINHNNNICILAFHYIYTIIISQCNNFISITKYQRNYQTTLKELAKKFTENATILCDYILAEENDINIKEIN